jgi:hypothetical protein
LPWAAWWTDTWKKHFWDALRYPPERDVTAACFTPAKVRALMLLMATSKPASAWPRKFRELAGMPFVAFGLLHYLRLANMDAVRVSPVEMAWRSSTIQLCSAGWLIATLWSLGVF